MTDVTIRRLAPEDGADFRSIRLEALRTAPAAFGSDHATEAARPPESFSARLADSVVFGGYVDGAIAGMVGLARHAPLKERHKAFIWGMYVSPAARGTGLADRLMETVLAAAREMVEQVILTSVAGNAAAMRFYLRHGFTQYGLEPRAMKDGDVYVDEALMVRFLRDGA